MTDEQDELTPKELVEALAKQRALTLGAFAMYARLLGLISTAIEGNAELEKQLTELQDHAMAYGAEHGRTACVNLSVEEKNLIQNIELLFCRTAYEQGMAEHSMKH